MRATRPINLVLLAWTLISFRFFLMLPVLETRLLNFGLDHRDFLIMVLGATLLAGAGNLINDYFDRDSDHRNGKRRPVIAENLFWPAYWGLNGVGLSLCAWSAWQAGLLNLTLVPIAAVFLLFRYSEHWKKQGLIGPLVIVFLCFLWVALPWLYEFKAMGILFRYYRGDSDELHRVWLIYLAFCTLITLSRELIKACEDYAGDLYIEAHTVAVIHGIRWTTCITSVVWSFVWGLNTFIVWWQWTNQATMAAAYSTLAWLWSSAILWKLVALCIGSKESHSAQNDKESDKPSESIQPYRTLSLWIKLYFAIGILSLWAYYMIVLYGTSTP